MDLSAALPTQG